MGEQDQALGWVYAASLRAADLGLCEGAITFRRRVDKIYTERNW